MLFFLFFFNATAPTEIYTLSLHDALPISRSYGVSRAGQSKSVMSSWRLRCRRRRGPYRAPSVRRVLPTRSEEHTSELQSHVNLVCRLLLEKKKTKPKKTRQYKTSNMTSKG